MTREISPENETRWCEGIKTPTGHPMMYRAGVKEPVAPTDATHVGPVGDYWRMEMDHDELRAHAFAWDGETWFDNDALFVHGLMDLDIEFKSVVPEFKDMNAITMITELLHRASTGNLPLHALPALVAAVERYKSTHPLMPNPN